MRLLSNCTVVLKCFYRMCLNCVQLTILGVDLPNRFGRCPLHTAILKGDYKMVKIILEAHADVTLKDDRGDTPLHYAVRSGNELITRVGFTAAD